MVVRSSSSGTTDAVARISRERSSDAVKNPVCCLLFTGAVGAQHVDAALVCALGRAARLER